MEERFRQRARAAMRIPAIEALFPEPWPAAARNVLPSLSPHRAATAVWGPVFAWNVLELLAESVNPANPQAAALDLFDRLRMREPLAQAFQHLGFEAEESWRVAARIKVALLIEARVFAPDEPAEPLIPVLSPLLWQDPDVRWLTGAHEDEGKTYFVKESYEELLWWLQLPALCKLAAAVTPSRSAIQQIGRMIAEATASAARAGYCVEALFKSGSEVEEREVEQQTEKPEPAKTGE